MNFREEEREKYGLAASYTAPSKIEPETPPHALTWNRTATSWCIEP